LPPPHLRAHPEVTLFISSLNTRPALELTLASLVAHTSYPAYRVLVGDNASTDGSREYLDGLASQGRIALRTSPGPRPHSDWLDDCYRQVETPYWVAVDSDMLFLGRDWLADLIAAMERHPDVDLIAAERRAPSRDYQEPVSNRIIDLGEAPSTWLFCARTGLRERLDTSFAFYVDPSYDREGRRLCFDTGGRVLRDMRSHGLRYRYMPSWFRAKYLHFGGMSWAATTEERGAYAALKQRQQRDIARLLAGTRSR
jgi:glycosyltransferase involved in cell wall biosynthesis